MAFTSLLLSGVPGSGKSTLATELQKHISWPYTGIGDLFRARHIKIYPNNEVSFPEYLKTLTLADHKRINDEIRELLKKGGVFVGVRHDCIADGIGGVLKIFLTADIDTRVQRALGTKKYEQKTPDEIRRDLEWREEYECSFARSLYSKTYDYRNPEQYHLVINSTLLELDQKVGVILSLLH